MITCGLVVLLPLPPFNFEEVALCEILTMHPASFSQWYAWRRGRGRKESDALSDAQLRSVEINSWWFVLLCISDASFIDADSNDIATVNAHLSSSTPLIHPTCTCFIFVFGQTRFRALESFCTALWLFESRKVCPQTSAEKTRCDVLVLIGDSLDGIPPWSWLHTFVAARICFWAFFDVLTSRCASIRCSRIQWNLATVQLTDFSLDFLLSSAPTSFWFFGTCYAFWGSLRRRRRHLASGHILISMYDKRRVSVSRNMRARRGSSIFAGFWDGANSKFISIDRLFTWIVTMNSSDWLFLRLEKGRKECCVLRLCWHQDRLHLATAPMRQAVH